MTNDVAIIGVGLHPFGRFDKTAMQMGAEAIQFALDDAGVGWKDIQFGFGGSHEVSNPDAVTRLVGLTGITLTNVFNACATAASAIQQTADTIRLGKYDIGIAIAVVGYLRLGTGEVTGSLAGYQVIDDQTASVTISVTRADPSRPVDCIVRVRSKDGSETGRREVLVPASDQSTVQVTTTLKSSKPPVMADVYGCGTDVPGYLTR